MEIALPAIRLKRGHGREYTFAHRWIGEQPFVSRSESIQRFRSALLPSLELHTWHVFDKYVSWHDFAHESAFFQLLKGVTGAGKQ